jgi:hypothetical protein
LHLGSSSRLLGSAFGVFKTTTATIPTISGAHSDL